MLNKKNNEKVWDIIDSQGFEYAFSDYYSELKKIKDDEFNRLATEYLKAADALRDYIGPAPWDTDEEEE